MNTQEYNQRMLGDHFPTPFVEPTGPDMCDPTPYPTLAEVVERSMMGERIAGLPGYYDDGVPVAIPRNLDLSDLHEAGVIIEDAQRQIKNPPTPDVNPSSNTPVVDTPQQ